MVMEKSLLESHITASAKRTRNAPEIPGEITRKRGGNLYYQSDVYSLKANPHGRISSLQVQGAEFLRRCTPGGGGIGWYNHDKPILHPFYGIRSNYLRFSAEDSGLFLQLTPDIIYLDCGFDIPDLHQEFRLYLAPGISVSFLPAESATPSDASSHSGNVVRCNAPNGAWIEIAYDRVTLKRDKHGEYLVIGALAGVRTCGQIRLPQSAWTAHQLSLALSSAVNDHHFSAGQAFSFDVTCRTIKASDQPRQIQLQLKIADFNSWIVVQEETMTAQLVGESVNTSWNIPWDSPGPWRICISAVEDRHVVANHDAVFVYDVNRYLPPLYRPADFWDFWQQAISDQRKFALDPTFSLLPEQTNDQYATYEVHITGYAGRRITGIYREPLTSGQYPVLIGNPMKPFPEWLQSIPSCTLISYQLDGKATYRTGLQDKYTSNLFYNYLDLLRWVDFFATREMADLQRSAYITGSRGGPIGIALLALDQRIQMCIASVPTNNRWDWQMRYPAATGWGPTSARFPDQSSREQVIKQLAYFDPSHFAERVQQSVLMSVGLLDEFSQVSGNLACFARLAGRKHLCCMPLKGHDDPDDEWYAVAVEWLTELFQQSREGAVG